MRSLGHGISLIFHKPPNCSSHHRPPGLLQQEITLILLSSLCSLLPEYDGVRTTLKFQEPTTPLFFIFYSSLVDTFSLLLEKKGERETLTQEKSISWLPPLWQGRVPVRLGPNSQPRHVPGPGIKPATLQLEDDAPTNSATLAKDDKLLLFHILPGYVQGHSGSLVQPVFI